MSDGLELAFGIEFQQKRPHSIATRTAQLFDVARGTEWAPTQTPTTDTDKGGADSVFSADAAEELHTFLSLFPAETAATLVSPLAVSIATFGEDGIEPGVLIIDLLPCAVLEF